MQLNKAKAFPYADGAPKVPDPVFAVPECGVYYYDGTKATKQPGVNCARSFATIILATVQAWCLKHGFPGFAHVGVFASRLARKASGQPFIPHRWSNHSRGEAMDFKGIMVSGGKWTKPRFMSIEEMKTGCPAKLDELMTALHAAIEKAGRRPEIVWEPSTADTGWIHIGMYPAG